jgi:hypothetical protein
MPYRKRSETERVEVNGGVEEYARVLGGGRMIAAPHMKRVDEVLENAIGTGRRVIITMPPRHSKSTRVCLGLARIINLRPDLVHAYCTYSQRLSDRWSRVIRRHVEQCGIQLSPDENRIEGWRTIQDGGLNAVGVQGPLTGFGISGVAVVDDPIKDRADAESKQIRDTTWDWLVDVLTTRMDTPDVSIVVTATRWHVDDPSGRLLRGQLEEFPEWEHIHLRAIENDNGVERALWPERWPLEALQKRRGPWGGDRRWWSLYQGEPRPDGSSIFGEPTFGFFPGDEQMGLRVA